MIIRTGFTSGAVAPEVRGAVDLFVRLGGEFMSQRGDEHGFGPKMFAKNRLAHNQAFS